jgi:Transposase
MSGFVESIPIGEIMLVVGIDICKNSVAAVVLGELPSDVQSFFRSAQFLKLPATVEGIKELLAHGATHAVMEPTGVHYARLWGYHLAKAGITLLMVDHAALKSHRKHLQLPLKNDNADALALACYGLEYMDQPRRFLRMRNSTIIEMRGLVLRIEHLNRCQSPLVNHARQLLAWQFPEVALVKSNPDDDIPLLWGWLAGQRTSERYESMYAKSVGLGVEPDVKFQAERIINILTEKMDLQRRLNGLALGEDFSEYREIFDKFGFGDHLSALLLTQMFPFEDFLSPNGKPIRSKSDRGNTQHVSLGRFKNAVGLGARDESSGDRNATAVGGAALSRKTFWLWAMTRIAPQKTRGKTDYCQMLGSKFDSMRLGGVPGRLALSRICVRASRLLFNELCQMEFLEF